MFKLFVVFLGLIVSGYAFSNKVEVTDFTGRYVSLDKPAKRIITLAPHIVENVFSAGAGDLIVGTVDYSDYPQAARGITRIGSIQGFSAEAIVALKPDLVLAWASGHSSNISQQLIDLGLTVYLDEPKRLEEVAKSIRDIGILTGRQAAAERTAEEYLKNLDILQQKYSKKRPVSMLYQVWNEPLRTISGNHIITDVIHLCGGVNIFADEPVIAPKISIESVLARNPQAIVASGMGDERPDWLDEWKQWKTLTAVHKKHLFFVPPDLIQRHTVRLLEGADILCQQLDQVRLSNEYK
jgi:iron complex transport system substrate-binding protein